MSILEIKHLSKKFTSTQALDDVTFNVEDGTITGILGPNGAGKTTLLRIINSIITFDGGEVLLDGKPVNKKNGRIIGYMPEERGLYDKLSVEEQIIYFGKLKGGDERRLRLVMHEYLDLFGLNDQYKRKIKELSKGNQQKVQIISTLVHEPKLVILDEPFSGFDPINGAILTQVISRLQEIGSTIILSSHNMPAIEEMCSDIALIDHGHLLIKDKIENIKEANRDHSLLLTVNQPLVADNILSTGLIDSIRKECPQAWRKGYSYRIMKKENISNSEILAELCHQSEILHFEERLPSLKEIFLKYTAQPESVAVHENLDNELAESQSL